MGTEPKQRYSYGQPTYFSCSEVGDLQLLVKILNRQHSVLKVTCETHSLSKMGTWVRIIEVLPGLVFEVFFSNSNNATTHLAH